MNALAPQPVDVERSAGAESQLLSNSKYWRPTFSMRGLLLLVFVFCLVAGFVNVNRQLRLAQEILEVNGLRWEPTGLADDEFRVIVQHRINREDLKFYAARIHVEGQADAKLLCDGRSRAGIGWNPQPGGAPQGCWVTFMYDIYTNSVQPRAKLDVEISKGNGDFGQHLTQHFVGDAANASIMPQIKSGVYKRGQAIPLFELDGKKYTLLVK